MGRARTAAGVGSLLTRLAGISRLLSLEAGPSPPRCRRCFWPQAAPRRVSEASLVANGRLLTSGGGGIRTHGQLAPSTVFKTVPRTPQLVACQYFVSTAPTRLHCRLHKTGPLGPGPTKGSPS